MEEPLGQQYALQVALQTMKERCLKLQQRLSKEEEENLNLKLKYQLDELAPKPPDLNNKSEIELLQQKVAQLTKQKSQLTYNVQMVATENRNLWNRLSKLTQANQTNLNDNLNQTQSSHPNLIRSETFTHESPTKLTRKPDNETYSDTSLEDISLKILSNIAQEKYVLEKQCEQMVELQNNESFLSNSIGFSYPQDEVEDGEFAQNIEKLGRIKEDLIEQREKLKKQFELFKVILEANNLCKGCKESAKKDKSQEIKSTESSSKGSDKKRNEHICPICSQLFFKDEVPNFVQHVQSHFIGEENLEFESISLLNHVDIPQYYCKNGLGSKYAYRSVPLLNLEQFRVYCVCAEN